MGIILGTHLDVENLHAVKTHVRGLLDTRGYRVVFPPPCETPERIGGYTDPVTRPTAQLHHRRQRPCRGSSPHSKKPSCGGGAPEKISAVHDIPLLIAQKTKSLHIPLGYVWRPSMFAYIANASLRVILR